MFLVYLGASNSPCFSWSQFSVDPNFGIRLFVVIISPLLDHDQWTCVFFFIWNSEHVCSSSITFIKTGDFSNNLVHPPFPEPSFELILCDFWNQNLCGFNKLDCNGNYISSLWWWQVKVRVLHQLTSQKLTVFILDFGQEENSDEEKEERRHYRRHNYGDDWSSPSTRSWPTLIVPVMYACDASLPFLSLIKLNYGEGTIYVWIRARPKLSVYLCEWHVSLFWFLMLLNCLLACVRAESKSQ